MDKKVLLIADDDEMSRKIIHSFLCDDYDVIEAENGKVALDILEEKHIDALLLDILMPELDGLELLKILRADKKFDDIGIVVATSTKEETERPSLSIGADDIISKPYDPVVIKKRLLNVLDSKELAMQKKHLEKDIDSAAAKHTKQQVLTKAEKFALLLKEYTAVINANSENFRLVAQITADINIEADKFVSDIEASL